MQNWLETKKIRIFIEVIRRILGQINFLKDSSFRIDDFTVLKSVDSDVSNFSNFFLIFLQANYISDCLKIRIFQRFESLN